jgi:hypothetical protein
MIHCRGCGQTIHESAPNCPHCGATQAAPPPPAPYGTLWRPVPALVCGIVAVLGAFGADVTDRDAVAGVGLFGAIAAVLAAISLARQPRGRGMAIAGLILGIVAVLAAVGSRL